MLTILFSGISRQRASERRFQGAKNCGRASRWISVMGICVTIVIVVTFIVLFIKRESDTTNQGNSDSNGSDGEGDGILGDSGSGSVVISWTYALFSVVVYFIFR